ncbi:hypothetical protein LINPERPRIM_LOCUS14712 [Linum perenne]
MFKGVPPAMLIVDGVSWMSSVIGKPQNKFVREGLDVKVCVIRDRSIPCRNVIKIETDDGVVYTIGIQHLVARDYKREATILTL